MRIKICGITRLEDARTVAEAGAEYLGFIFFHRSPRFIRPEQAHKIAQKLKSDGSGPILIGVFVNETAEAMASILDDCGLDLAQLSGEELPGLITEPSSSIYGRSFKGIRPQTEAEAAADAIKYRPPDPADDQPLLLLDAYHASLRGGTGQVADWRIAANLSRQIPRLMLAGGLNASNVGAAIAAIQPYAVDVSSGVEESPGIKSPEKIRAFIQAARPGR